MAKYHVNYNTGAGDFTVNGTLEEAMAKADEKACYTEKDIEIYNKEGDVVAMRCWIGPYFVNECDQKDPISFGKFGFYEDWTFWNNRK